MCERASRIFYSNNKKSRAKPGLAGFLWLWFEHGLTRRICPTDLKRFRIAADRKFKATLVLQNGTIAVYFALQVINWIHVCANSMTDRVVVAVLIDPERLFCDFFGGSIGATLIGAAFAPSPCPDLVLTVMGYRSGPWVYRSGWVNFGGTALALA
jgi:hypothetical protein